MKFNELCKEYISVKPRSPYSVYSLNRMFTAHVLPYFKEQEIETVNIPDAGRFLFYLKNKTSDRTGKHLAPPTIKSIYQITTCLFNYAVSRGYIQKNAFRLLHPRLKDGAKPIRFLTKGQAQKLLQYPFIEKQHKFCVYLALNAGLRPGEIRALRWEDVDLKRRILTIRRTAVFFSGEVFYRPPKNGKPRQIPINNTLYDFLVEYKGSHKQEPTEDILSISIYFHGWFKRVAADLGIDVSFKDLRKTFGTLLLMSGTDIFSVSNLLGHSSIKTTEKSYLGLSYVLQKEAVNRLFS